METGASGCAKRTCTKRFTKFFTVELGKHITVGQLYRGLGLHCCSDEQEAMIELSLAVDRHGHSRGLAFLRVPVMLGKYVQQFDGSLLKGEKLRVKEQKHNTTSLLKKMKWVRDYKFSTKATICNNQSLHSSCYQKKTDAAGRLKAEKYFDVGARLYHTMFAEDLDSVLAIAYQQGITKINIPCYNINTCKKAASLVKTYEGKFDIYFSAGVGPANAQTWSPSVESQLEALYQEPGCSSAGLIGLNLAPQVVKRCSKKQQLSCFQSQVKLACEYGKPLLLIEKNAPVEMLAVLMRLRKVLPPCALYCYTGSAENIKKYCDLGCYFAVAADVGPQRFSISAGMIDAVKQNLIPVSRLLLASDSPRNLIHGLPRECELPKEHLASKDLLKNTFEILALEDGDRSVPPCILITKDLIANLFGRPLDDKDLIRNLHNNTLKFFKLGMYREETNMNKARARWYSPVTATLHGLHKQFKISSTIIVCGFFGLFLYCILKWLGVNEMLSGRFCPLLQFTCPENNQHSR